MRAPGSSLSSNRDFARLWFGESVSALGSQVTLLAIPLLAVSELRATPLQMGLLGAAETVPFLLFALVVGAWTDRHRRRPILIFANVARALLLVLVPLLAACGGLSMEVLVAIAFLVGSCAVPFEVAYQSYLPRLVDPRHLLQANSRLTASESIAEIGGAGLGGILVAALTASSAVAVDAGSFLISAASIAGIRTEESPRAPTPRSPLAGQIREGIRETIGNPYLRAFVGEAATYNVAWSSIRALLVLWAVKDLGLSAATLGLLFSAGGAGALLGSLIAGPLASRVGLGRALWGSALLSNLGVLLIPTAGGPPVTVVVILGSALFFQGLGATATNVHTYAVRQAATPDRLMGRTTAAYRTITHGFIPIGALLGGLLGSLLGLHLALAVSAAALFPSWVWLYLSPARHLTRIPVALGELASRPR